MQEQWMDDERSVGSPERTNTWTRYKKDEVRALTEASLTAHGGPYSLTALCNGLSGVVGLSSRTIRRYLEELSAEAPGLPAHSPFIITTTMGTVAYIDLRDRRPARGQSAVRER